MPTVSPMKRWIEGTSTSHLLFFAVVAGFTSGIFARSFIDIGYAGAGLFALIGIALFIVARGTSLRSTQILFTIFLIAIFLGSIRFEVSEQKIREARSTLSQFENIKTEIIGEVVKDPDIRAARTLLTVRVTDSSARILVYAPARTDVSYGDIIKTEGILIRPKPFSSGREWLRAY